MPYKNTVVLLICLMVGATWSFAQPKINSPYSRIGIGDLTNKNFGGINGMADISSAFHDPFHLNFQNPASLSFLKVTAFEVGLNARYGKLESGDAIQKGWSGNLAYLSLGFPMKNTESRILDRDESPFFWGMGFDLRPYSLVGYDVDALEVHPVVDTINYNYTGTGGTYQILWGNGVRYKNFAMGANLGFVFGTFNNDRMVSFANLEEPYADFFNDDSSVRGFIWNLGAQYHHVFRKGTDAEERERNLPQLTVGAWGHSSHNIDIQTSRLARRFNGPYSTNNVSASDTIFAGTFSDRTFSAKLPAEFGIGVMYQFVNRTDDGKNTQWRFGMDYSTAAWSTFENGARPNEKFENSYRFALGAELLPDNSPAYVKSYASKIRYRIGGFYAKDPRVALGNNKSLTNYGITLGLGLPIIRKGGDNSFLNFALELGTLQGDADGSLKDTYGKLTLGITFNDKNWFKKRKFN